MRVKSAHLNLPRQAIEQIKIQGARSRATLNHNELKIEDNYEEELEQVMDNSLGGEERNFEMMISGGDYSPNSHTFFKHPLPNPCIESIQELSKPKIVRAANKQQKREQPSSASQARPQ